MGGLYQVALRQTGPKIHEKFLKIQSQEKIREGIWNLIPRWISPWVFTLALPSESREKWVLYHSICLDNTDWSVKSVSLNHRHIIIIWLVIGPRSGSKSWERKNMGTTFIHAVLQKMKWREEIFSPISPNLLKIVRRVMEWLIIVINVGSFHPKVILAQRLACSGISFCKLVW